MMLSRTKLDTQTQLEVDLVNHYKIFKRHSSHLPVGFESTIVKYQALLTKHQKEDHQMVLLTGRDGSGKSCLMSHLAKTSGELVSKDVGVILRYLANMNPPYNISDLFSSICKQISLVLKTSIEFTPAKSYSELKESFSCLLKTVARDKQSFLIVLDGLDSVRPLSNQNPNENAERFDWLTMKLPKNIHIVASFLTSVRTEEELVRMKDRLFYSENLLSIPSLEENHVTQIVKDMLKKNHRRLEQDQVDAVLNAVKSSGSPMLVELIMQDAMTWKPCCDCEVPDTIVDVVHSVSSQDFSSVLVSSITSKMHVSGSCSYSSMNIMGFQL